MHNIKNEYTSQIKLNHNDFNNEEIDFNLFFKFLLRNKKKILIFSLIFFILSCIYSLTLKKIWSGQFQIVLNSEKNIKNNFGPSVEQFLQTTSSSDLKTQVGILESPSILNPIYEFVLNNNKNKLTKENYVFRGKKFRYKISA